MPIQQHPERGTILMCDFSAGFTEPEMTKLRPVVVLSPRIVARPKLCTVVALSTTAPDPVMQYHAQIDLDVALPSWFETKGVWIKGDMVNAVGFHRLDLVRLGKDQGGKRVYQMQPLSGDNIKTIRMCVLRAMGLSVLTKHL